MIPTKNEYFTGSTREPSVCGQQDQGVSRQESRKLETGKRTKRGEKIWIDLDNSPHVPFFMPIIDELRERGFDVVLTARDSYQVCELLRFHGISCKVVGGHWGRIRALKILGTLVRALKLFFIMAWNRPMLAVSHGSRGQLLACGALRIPTLAIFDYEFTSTVGFVHPTYVLFPEILAGSGEIEVNDHALTYPGLKEDVYVQRLRVDETVRSELGVGHDDLVVTVRPPATEAHYHNPEAEVLLETALRFLIERPEVRVILLPRNERQAKMLRESWGDSIASRKIIIPEHAVDGMNLIWLSDLVISGGGTMNREAAALGVPVYSIFRGKIGAVDRYLADHGRLTLIEHPDEIHSKLSLVRRNRDSQVSIDKRPALEEIVNCITKIAASLDTRSSDI